MSVRIVAYFTFAHPINPITFTLLSFLFKLYLFLIIFPKNIKNFLWILKIIKYPLPLPHSALKKNCILSDSLELLNFKFYLFKFIKALLYHK